MKFKKLIAGVMTFALAVTAVSVPSAVYPNAEQPAFTAEAASTSKGVNVAYRTPQEIINYIKAHPFSTTEQVIYAKEPDMTSPYQYEGKLSNASLNNGLNALNVMRYIAGLDEVTLNDKYNEVCQAGSYVNALNGIISHYPAKPAGISDSIYDKNACGSSNLAMGYSNIADSIVYGYMYDSDSSNIDRLGHRRWCLNPAMRQTGFGQVGYFESMYSFDRDPDYYSGIDVNYWDYYDSSTGAVDEDAYNKALDEAYNKSESIRTGVVWPAQNMPIDYFDGSQAWSYSLGSEIINTGAVKVTLKRNSDNKTWTFSDAKSDGYFNIDNGGYGQRGCIVFRPNNADYSAGDTFTVTITGLERQVSYTVSFFSMVIPPAPVSGVSINGRAKDALRVAWNASSDADGYVVEVYDNGSLVRSVKIENRYTTEWRQSGLSAGKPYQFKVWAYKNDKGKAVYSTAVSITARTYPLAVTGLKLKGRANNALRIGWNKNTSADGYIVEMYSGGKWTRVAKITKNTTTEWRQAGLKAGTTYKFRVKSYKMDGKTALYSGYTEVSATTDPSNVSGVKVLGKAKDALRIGWNKNTSADGYIVEMYKNGSWVRVKKITSNATTQWRQSGLKKGTTYKFRVRAYKMVGKTALYSGYTNCNTATAK